MTRYARLDYTGRDFDSIKADLVARIQIVRPDWTNTGDPTDPGVVLLELLPYIGDLIGYYQDRQLNEAMPITALERANVLRHLRWIGYVLATATPATATLAITLAVAQTSSVVFGQGDQVTTPDGSVVGELVEQVEIPAGQTTVNVDWIEGTTVEEDLGTSDGTAAQLFTLGQTPYIASSETIVVDGVTWTEVTDFLNSGSTDQDYVVQVDAFDQASILFGDGTLGAIPSDGAQITASYRIGGGIEGNVEAGSLTKFPISYANAAGAPVVVTVTNAAAAAGGTDRETEAHGKLYGPKALATNGRAVTETDYATLAEKVSGVARAVGQTVDDDDTIDENTTVVTIVPVGSSGPSQDLLDATFAALSAVKTNTSRLMVIPAQYIDVSPTGTIFAELGQAGQAISQTRLQAIGDAALAALALYFNALNIDVASGAFTVDFGKRVPLSKLYGALDVDGVSYLDLASPSSDLVPGARVFPRLRAFTSSVIPASGDTPIQIVYTWTGLGTQLIVQQESA